METIYEWLLAYMGKEEKYYTILNAQRHDAHDSAMIEVLARTKDFQSVAMLIYQSATPPSQQPAWVPPQAAQTDFLFDDARQVVEYLETGEGATLASDKTGIHLILIVPEDDTAPIAFDQFGL
ncbi:hypothetical protein [Spirosoma sp. KUDC1026]|uniref:hypothetical protein n=1 Tax=Spirosoma sp. KUDC1026 TaxID=2745947 RepID=UPI00159BEEDE|nr:hypothetical protein [Spirosoma sp. KUDC1026]QKZ12973.1 hypothetical protein HU175_10140 [Spirosoma sp. KUDC1026]